MRRFEHIVHSRSLADGRWGELISFSHEEARWEWMNFRVSRLHPGEILESGSPTEETVLLLLGGTCHADWGTGSNNYLPSANRARVNLYRTGNRNDIVVKARDGDVVLVRDGFHPVVAGPGYDIYHLSFLAGKSRSMSITEDSNHTWIHSTWKQAGPGLPIVRLRN